MIKRLERALVAAMLATVLATSLAGTARAQANDRLAMLTEGTGNMNVGRTTSPPIGYVQFCARNPADCGHANGRGGRIQLDAAEYGQLKQVNDAINTRIQPLTDLEHYGEVERWTYPDDGYGDCEDYVLLKRRTLISLGWPAETLLIAVVRDRNGDGHSVLMVTTDHGDLVLDNQSSAILPWYETGYRYVKRQKQGDPDTWVSLGDVQMPATVGRN